MVRQKKKASRNLSFNVESDLHNANMSVKHHLDGYSDDDAGGMMDTWSSAIFGGDSFITNLNSLSLKSKIIQSYQFFYIRRTY